MLHQSPVLTTWTMALIAIGAGLGGVAWGLLRADGTRFFPAGRPFAIMVRTAGLAVVLAYSIREIPAGPIAVGMSLGIGFVSGFLWLVLSGTFGFGDVDRADWVAIVPFGVGLAVREFLTLHSIQEIEIQFAILATVKHSVVYPLVQLFFYPMVRDHHASVMFLNSVLGAAACAAAYQFVRQRLADRGAGFLCGLFIAVDPIVARFSPTDGPYSLLLASWFSALVFLSRKRVGPGSIFAGMVLLGIAATSRLEGAVLVAASFCLLDTRALTRAVRDHWTAFSAGALVAAALIAVQMSYLFPGFDSADIPAPRPVADFVNDVWTVVSSKGMLYASLVAVGSVSFVLVRSWFGPLAFLAFLIVVWPVVDSKDAVVLHRLAPGYAVLAIVAAIGARTIARAIPNAGKRGWLIVVPGAAVAAFVLVQDRVALSRPYAFNDEYDIVRRNLAAAGSSPQECSLLSFTTEHDFGIHDFGQVVPEMSVLDCRIVDCLSYVSRGGCFFYVRSSSCFLHYQELPDSCREGIAAGCLNPAAAELEDGMELSPIELRRIDLQVTFGPELGRFRGYHYPRWAELGLFRVAPRAVN